MLVRNSIVVEHVALSAEYEECQKKQKNMKSDMSQPNHSSVKQQLNRASTQLTGWWVIARTFMTSVYFCDTPHTINTTNSPSVPAAGQAHKV